MTSYPQLRDVGVLDANDISNLARQLHTRHRLDRLKPQILPHIKTLIKDLKSGSILGHPLASVHILSCLKEMEEFKIANEFWSWLVTQNEEHTDARVYGAAIENLAYQGELLDVMEDMYTEAIERYSDTVIPSVARDTGKGTKLMLFQGIVTARLLHGDWQAAYEGFDTCIRLYPTLTPPRLYELLIYERPVKEAYIVFLMACRAGSPPKPLVLTPLLKQLWSETGDIKAMIRAIYAFVGAGGKPSFQHLNSLISAILSSISNVPGSTGYDQVYTSAMAFIRDLVAAFGRVNVPPSLSTFNTIISLGGRLGRIDLIHGGMKEMARAELMPNIVTYRIILNAFGELNDAEAVRTSWGDLYAAKQESNEPWDLLRDLGALVRACIRTEQVDYCRKELERIQPIIGPRLYRSAVDSILREERKIQFVKKASSTSTTNAKTALSPEVDAEIKHLTRIFSSHQIHNFATGSGERIVDIDSTTPVLPHTELQHFYEELTQSVSKVGIGEDPLQRTSTGYTVEELRFENWRSVNRLLYEAELHEKEMEERVLEKARKRARGTIVEEEKVVEGKEEVKKLFASEERAKARIEAIKKGVERVTSGKEEGRKEELRIRGRMGGEVGEIKVSDRIVP